MSSQPTIVIISDCTDLAFAEMRGTIHTYGGKRLPIEPLVPVEHYSVINAAFALRMMADNYPPGTILCVIMNSLPVITERLIGITEHKNFIFEGANTGAFSWLIDDFGCRELYELHNPGFRPFGGKYVHSPVIGQVATGTPLSDLGTHFPVDRIRRAPIDEGTIIHVDNFGNIKFPWHSLDLLPGQRLWANIGGHEIEVIYWKRMMEREAGEWVLYPGSSLDLMEIGEVRGKGVHQFGIRAGDQVQLKITKEVTR